MHGFLPLEMQIERLVNIECRRIRSSVFSLCGGGKGKRARLRDFSYKFLDGYDSGTIDDGCERIDLQEFREAFCSQRIQLSSFGYKNDAVLARRGEQRETLTGANLMSNYSDLGF